MEAYMEQTRNANREGVNWKEISTKIRNEMGHMESTREARAAYMDSLEVCGLRRSLRVMDLVDLALMAAEKQSLAHDDAINDVAEGHARSRFELTKCPCPLRRTDIFSLGLRRTLIAEEMGGLLGFMAPAIKETTLKGGASLRDIDLRELFANSMAIPNIAAVIASILLNMPTVFGPKIVDPSSQAD